MASSAYGCSDREERVSLLLEEVAAGPLEGVTAQHEVVVASLYLDVGPRQAILNVIQTISVQSQLLASIGAHTNIPLSLLSSIEFKNRPIIINLGTFVRFLCNRLCDREGTSLLAWP
jgi:hypothetical protein